MTSNLVLGHGLMHRGIGYCITGTVCLLEKTLRDYSAAGGLDARNRPLVPRARLSSQPHAPTVLDGSEFCLQACLERLHLGVILPLQQSLDELHYQATVALIV